MSKNVLKSLFSKIKSHIRAHKKAENSTVFMVIKSSPLELKNNEKNLKSFSVFFEPLENVSWTYNG